jgi:hypothetical protein
MRKAAEIRSSSDPEIPVLELGMRGPRGEAGFLLNGPPCEGLLWDLEHEVASSRRLWLSDEEGWWVACSYFDTVLDVVLRFFPSVIVRYPDTGEERVIEAEEPVRRRAR